MKTSAELALLGDIPFARDNNTAFLSQRHGSKQLSPMKDIISYNIMKT